ncbi:hypothetical protein BGZ74_003692 [Mortierella antarctica]|nr:hypothetical protein BGZ74_003692 [Mortierella antarctica]
MANNGSGDGAILSRIFVQVALTVIRSKNKAMLQEVIIKLHKNTKSHSTQHHINVFLGVFPKDTNEITILRNLTLSKVLEKLVPPIANSFCAVNKAAKVVIKVEFAQFN